MRFPSGSSALPPALSLGCCACALGWVLVVWAASEANAPREPAARPASQIVRPLGIERALQRYLRTRWGEDVSRVVVEVLAPRRHIVLPAGRLSVLVRPRAKVLRPGRALFHVSFTVNGALAQEVRVAATITAYANLALTTRRVERGTILQEGDLRMSEWRIRAIEHGLVVSSKDAIGKRLQVAVPAGLPVPRVALEPRE